MDSFLISDVWKWARKTREEDSSCVLNIFTDFKKEQEYIAGYVYLLYRSVACLNINLPEATVVDTAKLHNSELIVLRLPFSARPARERSTKCISWQT